jgi:hypothetical protein
VVALRLLPRRDGAGGQMSECEERRRLGASPCEVRGR